MSDSQGSFVWYELMTTDMKAARPSTAAVVGWGTQGLADARHGLHALHERRVHGRRPDEPARRGPGRWARRRAGWATSASTTSTRRPPRRSGSAGRSTCEPRDIPTCRPLLGRRRSADGGLRHVQAVPARTRRRHRSSWHARPDRLARALRDGLGEGLRLLQRHVRLEEGPGHGHGADGHLPALRARERRTGDRRHVQQAARRSRRPSGSTTSTSTRSMPAPSGSRPPAARSSTVRWKCPAAPSSSSARIRRAPCSR